MSSKILAIIPAAGIGQRFGTDKPKQYEYIDGMTVIESAVKPFLDSNLIHSIVIPVSSSDLFIKEQSFFDNPKIEIVEGGFTRAESVYKSLCHVEIDSFDFVITHDAARPNVTEEDIVNIYEEIIKKDSDCSIFYIPVVDSIKKIQEKKTLDKANYYLVQTPQISKIKKLEQALKILISKDINIPDESFAIESQNLDISRLMGRSSNIKITHKDDINLLRKFSTRVGTGFDLHTYKPGKGFMIGGYFLECEYAIEAHSDGDVLLHSIADSILGASALGDIGIFFSDKDIKNKGLDSKNIINFCIEKINELNLEIYNIDATIICEMPKISPHREQIIDSLSSILNLPKSKIGLKATTAEKTGIIGKNKAIAVQSLVNLK
jgi:2-C-methyl-D-erythritol 4-phosphate cytidylyltransferase/2-C-methyl-D-erythritol 2,4-cyclodiphosphate synthase